MLHSSAAPPQLKSNKQSLQFTLEILSPPHVSTKQRALHVRQSITVWMGTKLDELPNVPDQSRVRTLGRTRLKSPATGGLARHSLTDLCHRERR